LSLIGPFVNLLIVPLITPITIFGFILAFVGLISINLGLICAFPIWLILTYILKVIDLASQISFGDLVIESISFIWVIIFYIGLGLLIWRIKKIEDINPL
jgi:hypothetical protein